MNKHIQHLAEEAAKLSPEDQVALVDQLVAQLHGTQASVDASWAEEIIARIADCDNSEMALFEADDVLNEAQERLRAS